MLGPVEAWREDGQLPLGGAKQRSSLAVLLLNLNRVVPLDYFVTHLAMDEGRDARGAVRRQMSRLRQVLNTGEPVLATRQGGYVLSADPEAVDLRRFERLVRQGRGARAAGDYAQAAALLGDALALWRGQALTGVLDGVRELAAPGLEEARLHAVEDRAELRIMLGEHEPVVTELREVVAAHPVRERLVGLLMLALSRSGRQAEALEVFTRTRHRLVEELGLEPGETLRQAQRKILAGEARKATPVRLPAPAQLPADLATFTGRADEVATLAAGGTLWTIDGMPGVGKTAFAVHAAHRLAPRYPDGQLFLDLHGFTEGRTPVEPADALERLLRAVGLPGEQIPVAPDERAALWRGKVADRRVLVVLDNAAHESQVRPLLPGAAGGLVLVTSRRRLAGLDDAEALSLDVLPHADAVALFARTAGVAADESLSELVELCARLPLAIRLAAARLRHRTAWTPAHLVDRLRDEHQRLTELAAGDRSVTAAFDLSYAHLDQRQQRVFRLLGLHPGPDIEIHAAAALTQSTVDTAERLLEELLDAHLLQQCEAGRYALHDLVRAHAVRVASRSDPPPRRLAALSRLYEHYVHTAARATYLAYPDEAHRATPLPGRDVHARSLTDETDAARWLDTELPNLLAVAVHAHTVPLSAVLHRHLRTRGQYADAKALHSRAVLAAVAPGDRARALNDLGTAHRRQDEHDAAVACFTEAAEVARAAGDPIGELDALNGLGTVARLRARFDDAARHHRRALELARAAGDLVGEPYALQGLGTVLRVRRDYAGARECFEQALAVARSIGDRTVEPVLLNGLGHIHRARGHHDEAAAHFEQALKRIRTGGDTAVELGTLCALGATHRSLGRVAAAADCYRKALALADEIGDRNGQFEATHGLGHTDLANGVLDRALANHRAALAIARELGHRDDEARAHQGLALTYRALAEHESARREWQDALSILDELGLPAVEEVDAEEIRANLAAC